MHDSQRLFGSGRPAIVAHRGASRAARENTTEAFEKAAALRADAVELDVRRTADGAVVVHHDAAIDGVGVIAKLSLDELREAAPFVPTLAEAMDACAGMWVNVEIKNLPIDPDWDPDERLAADVARMLDEAGLLGRVLLSSFNPGSLARARQVAPAALTGLLAVRGVDPVSSVGPAAEQGHRSFHPAVEALQGTVLDETVAAAASAGVALVVWTVDDPEEIARLARAGVAGIITNVPDVARRALP